MLFNSLVFLIFACIFFPVYFLTQGKVRQIVCLVSSYIFYGWWDWRFLALIFFVTVVNYVLAKRLAKAYDEKLRLRLCAISVVICMAVLVTFKYYGFFLENLFPLMETLGLKMHQPTWKVLLPVGISFYTFQAMSYTIDVYRRKLEPEHSFIRLATYIAFFPQLVAGPIVRASHFLPQLSVDHKLTWNNFLKGSMLVLWGYFLKCAVADSLAMVVDTRFNAPYLFNSVDLAMSIVFYAFQIYGDFAGYSYIAIGFARILGFDFGINFNKPYFATDFSDFWRRWHISLSTWLRDYLYIPLGGSRQGTLATYRNLMITMLLGGLWHGTSWNFIVWGGLHGLFLIVQRFATQLLQGRKVPKAVLGFLKPFRMLIVFYAVCIAWIFFRASDFSVSWTFLTRIHDFGDYRLGAIANKFLVAKSIALVGLVVGIELLGLRFKLDNFIDDQRRQVWLIPMAVVLLLLLALFGTFQSNAFIYFQF